MQRFLLEVVLASASFAAGVFVGWCWSRVSRVIWLNRAIEMARMNDELMDRVDVLEKERISE